MSAWEKIVDTVNENRIVVGSLAGFATAFILLKIFVKGKIKAPQINERERFLHEIEVLKEHLNFQSLGKDDLKEILNLTMNQSHRRLLANNVAFKQQRRALRDKDFREYMKAVVEGIRKIQAITASVNADVLKNLGISQQRFNIATMQHPQLMNFMPTFEADHDLKELTLEQTRKALKFQKAYLFYHGQQLIDKIKEHSVLVEAAYAKQVMPLLFDIIINDERYASLGFEDQQTAEAIVKYKKQIASELSEIEEEVNPLINQLTAGNSMDADNNGQEDQDEHGDNQKKAEPQQLHEDFMKMMGVDPSILEGLDPELLGYETPRKEEGMNQQNFDDGNQDEDEGDDEQGQNEDNQEGGYEEAVEEDGEPAYNNQQAEDGNQENQDGDQQNQYENQNEQPGQQQEGYNQQNIEQPSKGHQP